MPTFELIRAFSPLAMAAIMMLVVMLTRLDRIPTPTLWLAFRRASFLAMLIAGALVLISPIHMVMPSMFQASTLSLTIAFLVQLLGTVISAFSSRYLEGEHGQRGYIAAFAIVLVAVHLLLLADHWVILILAWALVGIALQRLLCFYPERAFARLAAHKKRIADRLADALLIGAAALAWMEVGSGSLSALWTHVAQHGLSGAMQLSAFCMASAVVLRTALLPVHGWLIQVMEAPTPVSALLHAGVVNLGGFVLIRFAPLLEQATAARALLLVFGLLTAVLAGMVMLTRITIKVRLAWSTVAQMGFMLLECALGLYTFAALHLIGHSLYKAHTFLSASSVVRQTRQAMLLTVEPLLAISLLAAPLVSTSLVLGIQTAVGQHDWPWWWSAILGLAWAPLLWLSKGDRLRGIAQALFGLLVIAGLIAAALLGHALPLGIHDSPRHILGLGALAGMSALYLCLVTLQLKPRLLDNWRRRSYAGFYVDEVYTRLALRYWPTSWMPKRATHAASTTSDRTLFDAH